MIRLVVPCRRAFLFAGLILILLAWGCEGPEGPPGLGVDSFDLVPPEIELLYPTTGLTVYGDTLTMAANASDNDQLLYVEFFLDGRSDMGSFGRAVDSFPPYNVLWNFSDSDYGEGLHLLTARAVDASRNATDTPPSWIERATRDPLSMLFYHGNGEEYIMELPDIYGDRYFNVRFTPEDTCKLMVVYFEFFDPTSIPDSNYAGGCDIDVVIWNSTPEHRPGDELFRLRIPADEVVYNQLFSVNLEAENLLLSEDFHVGYSPAEELYDFYFSEEGGRFRTPIVINEDPSPLINRYNHRSGEFEGGQDGRGWGTMQEQWDNRKLDFHILALVNYEYQGGITGASAPLPEVIHSTPVPLPVGVKTNLPAQTVQEVHFTWDDVLLQDSLDYWTSPFTPLSFPREGGDPGMRPPWASTFPPGFPYPPWISPAEAGISPLVIPAKQAVRECRLCEERSDEAICKILLLREIASLRSQRRPGFSYSRTAWKAGIQEKQLFTKQQFPVITYQNPIRTGLNAGNHNLNEGNQVHVQDE